MKNALLALALIALIAMLLCLCPMLFLWAINTLAEQSNVEFYIVPGFWSYLASLVLLGLFAGSNKASK